ncbi:hypothetical protein GCK72_022578 [Caenorhabditis remanei]|uniref:NTF2-like domain-containing protein n=1 Tax=Caenorhabditis remanei TaxID=31234 RepID=A0A6A5FUE8_CAERE|nr:hypothetical protein GCK72_022578 [Caenorhabditis remanei]KAF1746126.1 hypothetical protein GCK72_022578 [Caenorhabditis remanei]
MKLATAYNAQTGLSNFFEDSFNATDCNNKTIQKDEFLKNLLEYRKEDPHYPVNIIVAAQVMKDDFWTITYIIKSKETSAETEFVLNTHDFKLITAKSLNC